MSMQYAKTLVMLIACIGVGSSDVAPAQPMPEDAKEFIKSGNDWYQKRQYDKAMKAFDQAIKLDPSSAAARFHRGTVWHQKGQIDKAIADYSESIRLDPRSTAYVNRGAAWHQKGELEKAISDYDEAIRLDPKRASAFRNRALVWHRKREWDKAIADCSEAIRLDPNYSDAFNDRGMCWALKRSWAKALEDFNEAIRLDPKHSKALSNRAWIRATCPEDDHRNGKGAVEDAMRACELSKWENPVAISILAAAYAENGQFDEAVKWQKKALEFKAYEGINGQAARMSLKLYEEKKPKRQ